MGNALEGILVGAPVLLADFLGSSETVSVLHEMLAAVENTWELPQIRSTFLEVPTIWIMVFGLSILGCFHLRKLPHVETVSALES